MSVLECSAHNIPNMLRLISLDCSPAEGTVWRHDIFAHKHSEKAGTLPNLHLWVIRGKGSERVAEVLEVERGDRIAAYIRFV